MKIIYRSKKLSWAQKLPQLLLHLQWGYQNLKRYNLLPDIFDADFTQYIKDTGKDSWINLSYFEQKVNRIF